MRKGMFESELVRTNNVLKKFLKSLKFHKIRHPITSLNKES